MNDDDDGGHTLNGSKHFDRFNPITITINVCWNVKKSISVNGSIRLVMRKKIQNTNSLKQFTNIRILETSWFDFHLLKLLKFHFIFVIQYSNMLKLSQKRFLMYYVDELLRCTLYRPVHRSPSSSLPPYSVHTFCCMLYECIESAKVYIVPTFYK